MSKPLLRCNICGKEIVKGRWRGLIAHVNLQHHEYHGNLIRWIISTTPNYFSTTPTMDRIERALLKTNQFVMPTDRNTE